MTTEAAAPTAAGTMIEATPVTSRVGLSINDLANVSITVSEFEEQIGSLDRDGLLMLKTELDMAIARIKGQLDTAEARQAMGETVDVFWMNKARMAMRFKGKFIQLVHMALSKRNRDERMVRASTFEQLFINEAKAQLDAEAFMSIFDSTNQRLEAQSPTPSAGPSVSLSPEAVPLAVN